MIGTSHRGPHITVPRAPRERAQSKMAGAVYEQQPAPGLPPSCRLYTAAGQEVF
ncbi:unnamed protein product, partial [Staurois parvus]